MLRIAVYGKRYAGNHNDSLKDIFNFLLSKELDVRVHWRYLKELKAHFEIDPRIKPYHAADLRDHHFDLMVSVGGDGTFLDASVKVHDLGIPMVGINTGRLGFLARINLKEVEEAVEEMIRGNYEIEKRTLLEVETNQKLDIDDTFALNELTVHKKDSSSMITIHTYIDGEFLASYWADGLIVSTPTGSTAYSLSCGGPIVMPGSANLIITPIAPHNLNVRPMVISEEHELTLKIEGRSSEFLMTLDSRTHIIPEGTELTIRKSDFHINLLRLKQQGFLSTIRHKLNWGLDRRN